MSSTYLNQCGHWGSRFRCRLQSDQCPRKVHHLHFDLGRSPCVNTILHQVFQQQQQQQHKTKQRSLWHKVVFTQFIQITNSIQHHLCAFQLWNTECLRLENKTKHPRWRENWQNCWIFPVRAAFFILSYNVIKFYGEVSKSLICFYPNVSPPYTNIHIQLFSSTVNIHNPSFTLPTENILYFECLGS